MVKLDDVLPLLDILVTATGKESWHNCEQSELFNCGGVDLNQAHVRIIKSYLLYETRFLGFLQWVVTSRSHGMLPLLRDLEG